MNMPSSVQVNNITGTTPFDVYLCMSGGTPCYYISQINTLDLPYTFDIPYPIQNFKYYCLRVIDYDGCEITNCFNVI